MACLPQPSLVWLPCSGVASQNFWTNLGLTRKNRDGATVRWKLHNLDYNRFRLMHPCGGEKDERVIVYSALSMLSRANNVWGNRNATQAASVSLSIDSRLTKVACSTTYTKLGGNNTWVIFRSLRFFHKSIQLTKKWHNNGLIAETLDWWLNLVN